MSYISSKWIGTHDTSLDLHIELLRLAKELDVVPKRANGRCQAYFNGVWVGYYAGYGATPWQVGPDRVCVTREALVALLTKGEDPTVVSQSARTRKDIKDVLAAAQPKAEEPKSAPIEAPPVAMVAPGLDKTAIVTAAIAAKMPHAELMELVAALK